MQYRKTMINKVACVYSNSVRLSIESIRWSSEKEMSENDKKQTKLINQYLSKNPYKFRQAGTKAQQSTRIFDVISSRTHCWVDRLKLLQIPFTVQTNRVWTLKRQHWSFLHSTSLSVTQKLNRYEKFISTWVAIPAWSQPGFQSVVFPCILCLKVWRNDEKDTWFLYIVEKTLIMPWLYHKLTTPKLTNN